MCMSPIAGQSSGSTGVGQEVTHMNWWLTAQVASLIPPWLLVSVHINCSFCRWRTDGSLLDTVALPVPAAVRCSGNEIMIGNHPLVSSTRC